MYIKDLLSDVCVFTEMLVSQFCFHTHYSTVNTDELLCHPVGTVKSSFVLIFLLSCLSGSVMGFQDVAFLPCWTSFCTTYLKNCGSGEGLGTATCLETVGGGRQGYAPFKIFLLHMASFCVSLISLGSWDCHSVGVNLATLSFWGYYRTYNSGFLSFFEIGANMSSLYFNGRHPTLDSIFVHYLTV